jgi:hypothetical protein
MSKGGMAMLDVHRKLDWALQHHTRMADVFEAYAKPGGGDDRPYGIQFLETGHTVGSVVASFMVTEAMPVEMSLLAADVVHNTRTALEHVLARLKEHMGGDPGAGIFPTRTTEDLWQKHVVKARKGPLDGLPPAAVDLIYGEQPLHRANPDQDPLVILNGLDNADKHELLHPAWGEPVVARGVDMIEVLDRDLLTTTVNRWRPGTPLEHGTIVAHYQFDGRVGPGALRTRDDVRIGYATGPVHGARTGYIDMIDRVRGIAEAAAALIDAQP